jgi:hypothetical protein
MGSVFAPPERTGQRQQTADERVSTPARNGPSPIANVLALQHAAGNRAVARLLASRGAPSLDIDSRLPVAKPGAKRHSSRASRSPSAIGRATSVTHSQTASPDIPRITAADTPQSRVLASQRAVGNFGARAVIASGTRVLARMPVTVNRVDQSLRPVRAFGLLEDTPQRSVTEASSGELAEAEMAHERHAEEQSLVSSLLNQALGAPGAFHAGHLITRHLGGSLARHNMVPMTRQYNAWGTYKQFERELDRILAAHTKPGVEVIYQGRVYIDIKVTYPGDNQDDEIFRDLVAPDAVQEMFRDDKLYYDFLKSLCLRVPTSVALVELKKWMPFRGYAGTSLGKWVDVRNMIHPTPESVSPRGGGPAHYITRANWRKRRSQWKAPFPSGHAYAYKAPEVGSGEAERRRHAAFSFDQIAQNQSFAPFVFGASTYASFEPRSEEAQRAGLDAVTEYQRQGLTPAQRPARIPFGKRIDPDLEEWRTRLHPGLSLTKALETKTIDEIKAEAERAADVSFRDWLQTGKEHHQLAVMRDKLTRHPIMNLIAAYEAGQTAPV